ncbi:C-terminal binding protein [Bacillus shivajii]|uniref:C-terminal binding protein n=1 Tax=Bacillus shivajii TaxID=1983719 RepID=UPI001CFB9377|nr:C-terminal binding protein [Bacillus shivajii]UCZ53845.1 C-terminal binding protein [Bacillus shivajii]
MKKFKIVVTDYEYESLEIEREVIEKAGGELVPCQCKTEEEVINACRDADGILNQYASIGRRVIENLQQCKVISRYGVGVNTIDVNAAKEHSIKVRNVPDYCIDEVSDHAFALLISLVRKISPLNESVKNGVWDFKIGAPMYRLRGSTLGLVGFGKISQALAKKAKAFGINVIAYDPYHPEESANDLDVELVDLDTLCCKSNYISVHAPLTKETTGLISDRQFNMMKDHTYMINTSRGGVIDESSLIQALKTGKIAGAGLDVVEKEPIEPNNPLLKMDNVILNPHIAWYSQESEAALKRKAALNAVEVIKNSDK